MPHEVNIGLKNDQILQRYLVRKIFREAEFKLVETDGTEHIGYITGFDDKCIQISTTPLTDVDSPRSVLIFWPLRRIEETGARVDHLSSDQRQAIRSYSHALKAQCEKMLAQTSQRPRHHEASGSVSTFSDRL